MQMLDANAVLNTLPYAQMVDELAAMHHSPIGMIDEMLMESVDSNENVSHFFIRCGWQPDQAVGAKVITVFPRNNQQALHPSIQAVYILFEGVNGTPVACLDGTALTYVKTAADSALGSRILSRPDSRSMLMIGAGSMATHLISAHCAVRPSIEQVFIWNRNPGKAGELCDNLAGQFESIKFKSITDIKSKATEVDLICSAIGVSEPVIKGEWLQPGTHVDLVGAYTPTMREADDECLRRATLFVDARETTIKHIGELMIPIDRGVITEKDVVADLADLCPGKHPGRRSDDEITLFKNGGGGHLDLMVARILHSHNQSSGN